MNWCAGENVHGDRSGSADYVRQRLRRAVKILFLGTNYNPISIACLRALLNDGQHTISVGVLDPKGKGLRRTAWDLLRKRGLATVLRKGSDLLAASAWLRLRRLGISPRGFRSLEELSLAHRVEYFWCGAINAPASLQRIRAIAPDLIVVANFSQILRPRLLDIPPRGCINVHPSLLPRYRGPEPFYWVLKYRETETGVTVHYVDAGIDSGDIILQRALPIRPGEPELSLRERSSVAGAGALPEAIRLIDAGLAPRQKQDEREASYYSFPPRATWL